MEKKKKDKVKKNKKKDTKFKAGKSGNPAGRPPNSRNKAMSLAQIQDALSKGDSFAMNTVLEVMASEDTTASTRLRAALEWLGFDLKVREAIRKRAMDEYEFKKVGELAAEEEAEAEEEIGEIVPMVSNKAI